MASKQQAVLAGRPQCSRGGSGHGAVVCLAVGQPIASPAWHGLGIKDTHPGSSCDSVTRRLPIATEELQQAGAMDRAGEGDVCVAGGSNAQ